MLSATIHDNNYLTFLVVVLHHVVALALAPSVVMTLVHLMQAMLGVLDVQNCMVVMMTVLMFLTVALVHLMIVLTVVVITLDLC